MLKAPGRAFYHAAKLYEGIHKCDTVADTVKKKWKEI
jgi:hypothetical protein